MNKIGIIGFGNVGLAIVHELCVLNIDCEVIVVDCTVVILDCDNWRVVIIVSWFSNDIIAT